MALDHEEIQRGMALGCGNPHCKHNHDKLVITARCHPGAGTRTVMTKGSDVLTVYCNK